MIKNLIAGFWIRFLTRIIDLTIVMAISIGIAFALMEHQINKWHFKEVPYFYVWSILTILLFFLWFIIIPFFFKGKTFVMFITQIHIEFNDKKNNKLISLLKREYLLSLFWIFMLLLNMSIINHTLFEKFAQNKTSKLSNDIYSDLEKLRIGIVVSISSILFVIQFVTTLAIIVRKDKMAFYDRVSKTRTVWSRKFMQIKNSEAESNIKNLLPKMVKNEPIEWL